MFLSHLSLTHFRNYQQLELEFTQRLTLLQGQNAQGKSNLLEALYMLATSKPVHAQTEREVVDWQAEDEPIPYSRVAATIQAERALELEILFMPRDDGVNFSKQIRVNGVAKRSMDLIGLLRVVLFLPEDVKLVDGSPGERRRYLDIALCQIDPAYCRTLSAYQKVVSQRNSLLKNLREQNVSTAAADAQLGFWDEKLLQHGSEVVAKRHNFVVGLTRAGQERHRELTQGQEELALQYLPSFNYSEVDEATFKRWKDGDVPHERMAWLDAIVGVEGVGTRFAAKLNERRAREVAAGVTLYGPHRDDLRFLANGRDLRTYGSRGQQRTATLSLKLAEVQAMTKATGVTPLLLLDDVMSELDEQRRSTLLAALGGVDQAILTTTDWGDFTAEFRQSAQCLHVCNGTMSTHSP